MALVSAGTAVPAFAQCAGARRRPSSLALRPPQPALAVASSSRAPLAAATHSLSCQELQRGRSRRVGAAASLPRLGVACHAAAAPPLETALERVTSSFPLWVLAGSALGLAQPRLIAWFAAWTTPALALVMLLMGATIPPAAFRSLLADRRSVGYLLAGVALQYTIMPLTAFAITRLLPLSAATAAGLILVGCCPGGAASNLICFIAGADVALSVALTTISTALAAFATPALTSILAGQLVAVDVASLMTSTVTVVLLPLAAGLALQLAAPRAVRAASPWCPPVAVLVVALICGSIIANSAAAVTSSGPIVLAACFLLHAGGFTLGYVSAALLGFPEKVRRTVSVEVGMQNSALGAVLAMLHFGPAAAVPCALSATVHSVLGSLLAGGWRLRDAQQRCV